MPVYTSNETEAVNIMQNSIKADGPYNLEFLSGGLSGSVLIKVSTTQQPCVVRFWNKQWPEDFQQDLACQLIASDVGYGPKVIFADVASCVTVIEYLHPEALPEIKVKLQALVDLLKKMHKGSEVPKGIDKDKDLDESIEAVVKLNPQFIDLSEIRSIKETVSKALCHNASCVACHRDLNPGNLIYTQGRFFAIDYTWGGMDDPYVDLATLAIFNCVTSEEEQLLLQLYLGIAPSPTEISRLSLMKLLVKIFYGLEFLKLTPANVMRSTITLKATPKSYMILGRHGQASLNPDNFLDYAVAILSEAVDYSLSEQYAKDLLLMQK